VIDPLANDPRRELILGTAAEYLVCADLLLAGFCAFRADQAAAYDVAVDLGDRLIRVQVKGTSKARQYPQRKQRHVLGYTWPIRHGKRGARAYAAGSYDVIALVALDIRRIAYLAQRDAKQMVQIPVSGNRMPALRSFDRLTFEAAIAGKAPFTAADNRARSIHALSLRPVKNAPPKAGAGQVSLFPTKAAG
jgi:hypothetical protein